MKWLAMIISFVLGQLKSTSISPSLIFIQKAFERSRSLVFLATVSFVSALLFVAGIVIAAINGFSQYDQSSTIYMSATFVGGLVLAALSAISLAIIFSKKNWQVPDLEATQAEAKSTSPIEEAISFLINDFVAARRSDREDKVNTPSGNRTKNTSTDYAHPQSRTQEGHAAKPTGGQVH